MKPILFNTDMVRAILDGRKTATRRCVKPRSKNACGFYVTFRKSDNAFMGIYDYDENERQFDNSQIPPAQVGDFLYVRETWQHAFDLDENEQIIEGTGRYLYAADNSVPFDNWVMPDGTHRDTMPWRPSIHMPKEAARLFLRVTDVRVERLQDISPMGLRMEGVKIPHSDEWDCEMSPDVMKLFKFAEIWNSTIKPKDIKRYGWDANPWVWVIEFERISREEAIREENK